MSFRTKRVLFSTPFYMLFEFFLLKYIFLLFGGLDDLYLLILAVLIGLNRFVPMFFEAKKSRPLTRFLTTLDVVWMWASVMFLIDIVAIYIMGCFVALPLEARLALLAIVPILGIYNYWKAHRIVVCEKTLELPKLDHEISIAHLSDVHFGSVRHREIIADVSEKLNELDCDLAIISGDLADGSCVVEIDDFMDFSDVKMPIVFTPGNHDFYMGIDDVITACKNAGVAVLDNESIEIEGLNICGLHYRHSDRGFPEFDDSLIKPGLVNIMNYHVPYHWDEFSKSGFDVQLSGHTHGGQFYPAVWFAHMLFKYNMGLFKNDSGQYLHVTTGVGSMDVPMRWGTNSEIAILRLKKI